MMALGMRRQSIYLSALALAASSLATLRADFTPITLAPESFNQDIVVEKGAIHAPVATTASMDDGVANTGFGWYEIGYNSDSPDTGLPAAGSTVTSAVAEDHSYTFAADYTTNNAVLVDTNIPSATLTLKTPTTLAAISLLTSSGHGPATNNVVVHYANGSSETNSFVSADWFGSDAAVGANGRIDVGSLGFANVGSGNPNLYSVDVALTKTGSPVRSVEIQNGATGNTHTAVFAVSGATSAGGPFTPLAVTGFNQDLVVEAGAPQPLTNVSATTASMDGGVNNTGFSWYESGYNAAAPSTGLPSGGSTIKNVSAADHSYVLPESYTQNNAVLIDSDNNGTLRFATAAKYAMLSFLTSAGNGDVTVAYTVNHQDGSTDTGTFVSLDWFNSTNAAFIANGRVDVGNGALANVNSGDPRLFAVDIPLTNTNTPITTVDLSLSEGTGHAAVFAVSGSTGSVLLSLTISTQSDGTLMITSPVPGTLQSTTTLGTAGSAATVWADEGPINGSRTVTPSGSAKFYRLLVQQ